LPVEKINGVYYSTIDTVNTVQMGTLSNMSSAELDIPRLVGFSGYPYGGYGDIDEIIMNMTNYGANCWRVSFNPPDVPGGSRDYNLSFVDYFLDNTPDNWYVVVDGNHYVDAMPIKYPENQTLCLERVADILSTYPNDTRVLVELWNEPSWGWNTSYYAPFWIEAIQNSSYTGHYTNGIVVNKFSPYFLAGDKGDGRYDPWIIFDDKHDRVWQSFHVYVSQYPPEPGGGTHGLSYQDIVWEAANASIEKGVWTEVGAETDEAPFTQEHVDELNDYLAMMVTRGYGYNVWYNGSPKNIPVTNGYDDRGLTSPLP